MAYDEQVADRVRRALGRRKGLSERAMFGGLAFMMHGNMCCGVVGRDLMLRLGEDGANRALGRAHTRPMDFTGRPLKTMVYVEPAGIRTDRMLEGWLGLAVEFARSLPRKPKA
jgi:TfoX/Sxy family transcriptional regulator of competence genes